jgi:dCMP deaminase
MRTSRHQYFLDLALRSAHQGTCLRRNFGAIIVDRFNTIVSTGYTGAPRKQKDCTELKRCWRLEHRIPSGSNYEKCRSVHAEMNALLQAGKLARECTLYLAGYDVETGDLTRIWPCFLCSKMIVNSGIKTVIMRTGEGEYEEMDPVDLYRMRSHEALGDEEEERDSI